MAKPGRDDPVATPTDGVNFEAAESAAVTDARTAAAAAGERGRAMPLGN